MSTRATGLRIVGASAGTGKTYRLTEEVEKAVAGDDAEPIRPEGIVAVTYTRRAHVELESRIRKKLLASQWPENATRLPQAYLGTVHAVCLRWIREHALDVGLSPEVEVLADDALVLAQVLEEATSVTDREQLEELGWRLQIQFDAISGQADWTRPVKEVMALARGGRMAPNSLVSMAARSSDAYLASLPTPLTDGDALDTALERAVGEVLPNLDGSPDLVQDTERAIAKLQDFQRDRRLGNVTWSQWTALATLNPGARYVTTFEPVRTAAEAWRFHPRLHTDIRRFTELVYTVATGALERYAQWKRERRLVDYVDMIDAALGALEADAVGADLAGRLQLVVVDELQDSSPIQLALFLRLHAIARRSTWVGDPKQCIFEYQGADPTLMDAVLRWAHSGDSKTERLSGNYRARRELVELSNHVFARVFARHGMDRSDVIVESRRPDSDQKALEGLAPVGVFYLEARTHTDQAVALASGIERILAEPSATPVVDPRSKRRRPVEPGDIAILVRTNAEGARVARALAERGLRATFAREGLMATPEGVTTAAALRYVLDAEDGLALAQIEALQGWDGAGPDAWLTRRIGELRAKERIARPAWRKRLDEVRAASALLSPLEVVDAVLVAIDLATLAARWPDAPQRLANLDAIRTAARVYEQRCLDDGEGSSLVGLVRFLYDLRRAAVLSEDGRADRQVSGSDKGAVTVITYHRSKGLEWPVVVLSSLDTGPRPRTFDVSPVPDRAEIDPDCPLDGRWIRYFPWPFGRAGAPAFENDLHASPLGQQELVRERQERGRLLYVGFTRARDHLILAVRLAKDGPRCAWLREIAPSITLPSPDGSDRSLELREDPALVVPVRVWQLAPTPAGPSQESGDRRWFARATGTRPSFWIRPSAVSSDELGSPAPAITAVHVLHEPLVREQRSDVEWNRVGDALHAFLAADVATLSPPARERLASRILDGFGVGNAYTAASFVSASNAFAAFVEKRVGSARWSREIPVEARVDSPHGERRIAGRIDLLLETDDALIIVDHKSFPGVGEAIWRAKSHSLAPQLVTYASALKTVMPNRQILGWFHFATAGAVVCFDRFT